VPLKGYVALPDGAAGRAPGVIAFPGAAGNVKRMEMTVSKLAALGYVAAAVSMYDARKDTSDEAGAGQEFVTLLKAPETLRARARAWFDAFAAHEAVNPARLAAIGYCFAASARSRLHAAARTPKSSFRITAPC
jgi:dienelactone hydrolase